MEPRPWSVERAADALEAAERERADRGAITDEWPGLDLATAYRVQDELVGRRVRAGRRVTGVKLGLTSRAKQERMGISTPLTAWLTDDMELRSGGAIPLGALIHPRVEPEIVFVMGERLAGPGVTAERALDAVARIHAGLEVIDSRYTDFRFRLPDVVADNASSACYAIGDAPGDPSGLDLVSEACELMVDGRVADRATGAAVMGHPAQALALAANSLAERGRVIEPGWIVLTGGLTDAVPVTGSVISAAFTNLGTASLTC